MANKHWMASQTFAPLGEGGCIGAKDVAQQAFLQRALEFNTPFYQNQFNGTLDKVEKFQDGLKKFGASLLTCSLPTRWKKEVYTSYLIGEDGFVSFDWDNEQKAITCIVYSLNKDRHDTLIAFMDENIIPTASAGRIYMLKKTQNGFALQSIGVAGLPLERDNYLDEVVQCYDHVTQELSNKDPCGRLVILEGDPGTGKTYLIRSLIDASPKSLFVLVPPSLVEQLANPEFVPALVEMRSNSYDDEGENIHWGPTVLIFEDADSILVERQAQNMGGISACLNLSDGIIGSVLDLRIIASTNSKKVEIDEAILRDGRLCRYVNVLPLGNTQAHRVYERLIGAKIDPKSDPLTDKEHTLAEIYKKARKITGSKDEKGLPDIGRKPRQKRAGFHPTFIR